MGQGGPISPRHALVVGSWFLCREVELSTTRACLVSVKEGSYPSVSWCLPASKADLKANGVERTHFCECRDAASPTCPVCAMRAHLAFLAAAFPSRFKNGVFDPDFPLFPSEKGVACSKEAMASTFVAAARYLGLPIESLDGGEAITGHTLRVTGAQGLSRLGLDLYAIQLMGRWGSDAVRLYVRAVPLECAARRAASAAARMKDLAEVVESASDETSSPEQVLCDLAAAAPPRWRATVCGLTESLEVEVETSSPFPLSPTWVRNESTDPHCSGYFHVVSEALSGVQMGEWKVRCGWRFAGIPTVAIDVDPPVVADWYRVCRRCAKDRQQELDKEHYRLKALR